MNWLDKVSNFLYNDRGYDYSQNLMSRQGYSIPEQYGAKGDIPPLDLMSTPTSESHSFLGLGNKKAGEGILGSKGLDLGLKGLQTIAAIWNANKQFKLANKQFNMQKDFANANLNNTIQSYNTRLADRARSRGFVEGQSQQEIDDYINKNRLSR